MRVPPYERYAEIYDRIGQRFFGQRLAQALIDDPSLDLHRARSVADLACGTGSGALKFAAAGFEVTGVDRSPQMLAQAERSAIAANVAIQWLCQDLRELELPGPVDLAVSFYDSLNYILDDADLLTVFQRVLAALTPGGRFIFDLNSVGRLASDWADATMVAADDDDLFVIYRSTWDGETSTSPLQLTAFMRSPDGSTWERFDEEHIERGYAIETVLAILAEAGFVNATARQYHPWRGELGEVATERSERLVFIAERPP